MTTLYFWCIHELYSKSKLLCSTVKSHLSLRHNRHQLVNTKCILNTVSRLSSDQNNFFSPNSIITFQTWTSCWLSTNILIAACNILMLLKCTKWYLLFIISIAVDAKERPQQSAEEAATHTEHQRPCTSLRWDVTRWDLLRKEETHRIYIAMVHYSQLPKAFVRLQYFR